MILQSDFYAVNDVKVGGMRVSTLFSSRDEKWHAAALRPVRALYSMTQVLELEHLMDNIIDLLCKKLDTRFVKSGASCDIANYVLYGELIHGSVGTFRRKANLVSCLGCNGRSDLFQDTWDARRGV